MPQHRRKYGVAQRRLMTTRPTGHPPRLPLRRLASSEAEIAGLRDSSLAQLEAILFLADEPLTAPRLAELLGQSEAIPSLISRLRELYEQDGSPFTIQDIAGGYQLLTRPEYHPWLIRLKRVQMDHRLTATIAETLAVVAYRQPVTRAEIEQIRGVSCTEAIRQLMEKGLIRVGGRQDSLGRPQVYITTAHFLQVYGMNSLAELPMIASLPRPVIGP
jgi:segregation and condensation protein B